MTSLGICVGIGLTDLIIQIVKRNNAKKRSLIQDSDLRINKVDQKPPKGPLPPPDGFFPDEIPDEDGVELINEEISGAQ